MQLQSFDDGSFQNIMRRHESTADFKTITQVDILQSVAHFFLEWGVNESHVVSVTVEKDNAMVTGVFEALFGKKKLLNCFGHAFNSIAKQPFEELPELHPLVEAVQLITRNVWRKWGILEEDDAG